MIRNFKSDIKKGLIAVRQDPDYADIKSLVRRTLKYIDSLEVSVADLNKRLSKSRDSIRRLTEQG